MCGIWGLVKLTPSQNNDDKFNIFMNQKGRGPDRTYYNDLGQIILGFNRLAIMDLTVDGDQPFTFTLKSKDTKFYIMCNGEIYNFKQLKESFNFTNFQSDSDCEIILKLFEYFFTCEFISNSNIYEASTNALLKTIKYLDGEFAISVIVVNKNETHVHVARDVFGVRPLYIGQNKNYFSFSSELKSTIGLDLDNVSQLEPRKLRSFRFKNLETKNSNYCEQVSSKSSFYDKKVIPKLYFKTSYFKFNDEETVCKNIRQLFRQAVKKRQVSDREIGYLLSGGLDSSLVCWEASDYGKKKIRTFSVGLKNSTDYKYAKLMANHIDSDHTHIEVENEEDFLNDLHGIPYIIESPDTTTCRASTVQLKAAWYIAKHTDIKVVIVGEGSDELFGGYIYSHKFTNPTEQLEDSVRLMTNIHKYDGKRLDRCLAYYGLEARPPFLDFDFTNFVFDIEPKLKMAKEIDGVKVEKYILRKAYEGELPHEILYRPKEAQSDGCSSVERSWHKIIQENIKKNNLVKPNQTYNISEDMKPKTLEDEYFLQRFIDSYGEKYVQVLKERWLPPNCDGVVDPSARELKNYRT